MSDQALTHPAGAAAPAASPSVTRYWRTEDWIAVVLGFVVITAVLLTFQWKIADLRSVVPSFRWTTNEQIELLTPNWNRALDQIVREAQAKGQANVVTLSRSLKDALATQDRRTIETAAAKLAAVGSRTIPGALGAEIRSHAAASTDKVFTHDNLLKAAYVGIGFVIVGAIGIALVGSPVLPFLLGLPVVFGLAFGARFLAGNGLFVDWGIEYVIFALGLGLLISNTVTAVLGTCAFLLCLALACWIYGAFCGPLSSQRARLVSLALITLLVLFGARTFLPGIFAGSSTPETAKSSGEGIEWKPFSTSALEELLKAGDAVFVDFTADWCISCKFNERVRRSMSLRCAQRSPKMVSFP